MTEPSRSAPSTDNTEIEGREQLDPTLARPDGEFVLPSRKVEPEPNFGPPEKPGEVGTLGRYRVLKKLGRGGMGAVYLAYDTILGRRIALKVMLPQYAVDGETHERFLREARAAAMVRSDHVVTIYDVSEERGVPFIAMEYLSGYPLDQYLRVNGELPLEQIFRIGRETALGLTAAHELGLIHRDVKPGNIWLEAPHGRVKLLDFGLARAQNDDTHLTSSGLVVGTPAFMSPEQARGLKLDGRSDLFSLGVMLYRLTTGHLPFSGTTTMAILTALAVDTPPPVRQLKADVPEALEAIIAKLLAKDPAQRFQTAWEVAEALRAAELPRPVMGSMPVVIPITPMAIAAQAENVWEAIEASASSPRVLESGTETSVATPSVRTKPERKPSLLPLILAGVGLFLAVGVLVAVLASSSKEKEKAKEPVAHNSGNDKRPPVVKPPTPVVDPDRKAAEWVLSVGGNVNVDGQDRTITAAGDLPRGPFTLTNIGLNGNKQVTDAGLTVFKDCRNLAVLGLSGTSITDAGLANFKDLTTLTFVWLEEIPITDAGLANLRNCKQLVQLSIGRTGITDAGLVHFKDCGQLGVLTLGGTRVTDAGLAHFKNSRTIWHLQLQDTSVADAGLEYLKGFEKLQGLMLGGTAVTDAGLVHLAGLEKLTDLRLGKTKVTQAGVEKLAAALPKCKIEWDGGTIEPRK